jgi:ribonuclease HII
MPATKEREERYRKKYEDLLNECYPDFVIGVDECGKGSLAGPMVICATAWFPWFVFPTLKDSKKMGRKQIYETAEQLKSGVGVPYIMGVIEPSHIDAKGIDVCWQEGVAHVIQVLRWQYDDHDTALAIIDGGRKPKWGTSVERMHALPKADNYCPAVQAAAIIAKCHQLQVMETAHNRYPNYGFDKNAGYGTPKHMDAIKLYGPSPIHRMSFEPMCSLKGGEDGNGIGSRCDQKTA